MQTLTPSPWLDYPIRVHPSQTDYAGVAWHGSYWAWLEEARIDCLRRGGIEFADLVELGCDLPVIHLEARYLQALKFGDAALVRTRFQGQAKIRLCFDQCVTSQDRQTTYFQAQVQLVPLNRQSGKILRHLPDALHQAFRAMARCS